MRMRTTKPKAENECRSLERSQMKMNVGNDMPKTKSKGVVDGSEGLDRFTEKKLTESMKRMGE